LEVQAATETAASNAQALNERDLAAANAATADTQFAIARLRRSEPSGRIVLQLKPDSLGVDSVPDLALEDGDRFVVPRIPSNVNVEGQVYSANAFVYKPGQYGKFDRAIIYPGDTIVVPPILQKRAILRNLVDIATIVGQFGLGLAAINVLK
jgi:polysaccharide biosynthesis/export protein